MSSALVFQSDFGLVDGAVAAMYGVALDVDKDLRIFNLTHDITPYNIWEASYRLYQSVEYWPEGTVFVSVVDPGVGSSRKSVVAKTSQGQFIVTPDNGTLTHIKKNIGIVSIREIEEVNAAKRTIIKKIVPIIAPPDILPKTLGNIANIRLGPVVRFFSRAT